MKNLRTTVLGLLAVALVSCGGGIDKQPANAEGFAVIEKEMKTEFGENAYYTDLTIMYDETMGNYVSTTVTDDPESLEMGEWSYSMGNWTQSSDIKLELPEGTKAADFMFQLNGEVSLKKMGELVEKSKTQLTAEHEIENPRLEMAFVKFPDTGDLSETSYSIQLEPEHGGTKFSFYYTLGGDLIEMDY